MRRALLLQGHLPVSARFGDCWRGDFPEKRREELLNELNGSLSVETATNTNTAVVVESQSTCVPHKHRWRHMRLFSD